MNLVARATATDKVLRRFRSRPFSWKDGATCIHLFRAQLFAMGHRPPRVPAFRSALGARKALEKTGHKTLEALLDSMPLPRIPPAAMLIGDIGLVDGEAPFDALVIAVGGGKVAGWIEGHDVLANIQVTAPFKAAWRA